MSRLVLIYTPGPAARLRSEAVQFARCNTSTATEEWILPNGSWPPRHSVTHWAEIPDLPDTPSQRSAG
ncbi:MAG: hypothetical protein V4671_09660 [Armatimonadota bacterium]